MDKVSVPPTARPGSRGRLGLSSRMLIGLALGVLLGLFIGEPAGALQPIADVCIRLMQMTVLPYLVLTLIVGPGELDAGAAKRLAWRAGLTFVVPSAAALAGHCASPCLPTVGWAASPPAIVAQTPPVPPAHATGAASAQAAHASAPVEAKASRTLVVRGKVFDLDAPLPVGPRTLPDGHPLLRETALADDRHEFGGRMAPDSDTPDRRAIHDAIVADTVAGVTPQTVPVLYVMAGGGGSGKGFVRARLEATGEIPTRNRVLIDPDEIMERLPEWRLFKDAGDGRAATMLHEESSMLAKRIRALAATRRLDVVLDVALSDASHARATFEQFRHAGYAIVVFAVATDARVSAAQAADRARQSNRWVPWSVLLEAHRALAAAFEGYARLVDRLSLFDNNGEQPIQIAERDADGGLRVLDVPAYRRWLESSRRINPDATTLGEIYGQTRQ